MDDPLRIKGTTYEQKIVAVTRVEGSGGYDTGEADREQAVKDDLRSFMGKVPTVRGYFYVDITWRAADPAPAPPSECEVCDMRDDYIP